MEKYQTDTSLKDIQMTRNHVKRCLTSLFIKEMKIQTTMRYQCTSVKMAKIENDWPYEVLGEDVDELELSYTPM